MPKNVDLLNLVVKNRVNIFRDDIEHLFWFWVGCFVVSDTGHKHFICFENPFWAPEMIQRECKRLATDTESWAMFLTHKNACSFRIHSRLASFFIPHALHSFTLFVVTEFVYVICVTMRWMCEMLLNASHCLHYSLTATMFWFLHWTKIKWHLEICVFCIYLVDAK